MDLEEMAVFVVHAIQQFCFGFETMNNSSEEFADGGPAKAFFLNAIYHYLAEFYLLDKGTKEMGGALYDTLKRHGLEGLLDPMKKVLEEPLLLVTPLSAR